MLCDAHCHLEFDQFDPDRDEILEKSKDMLIIDSVIYPGHVSSGLALAKKWPNVKICLGLAPANLDAADRMAMVQDIKANAKDIIGIGEVGLDHYWVRDDEGKKLQEDIFAGFIKLSKKTGLPLVLHTRDAEGETIEMIESAGIPALMHCFSGTVEQALHAVDLGCPISIPTNVTFVKSRQRLAKVIPLESLCIETDAPYLAPERGQRNEPSNIGLACEKIAKLRGISPKKVEDATTENVGRFFGI